VYHLEDYIVLFSLLYFVLFSFRKRSGKLKDQSQTQNHSLIAFQSTYNKTTSICVLYRIIFIIILFNLTFNLTLNYPESI